MAEMKFGYVRVSTAEQNEARQMEALRGHGVEDSNITVEKVSGKNLERPGLKALLGKVRAGDTVVVASIDRLGRNTKDVLTKTREIEKLDGIDRLLIA